MASNPDNEIRMHPLWRFLLAVVVIFGTMTLTGAVVGTVSQMAGVHPRFEVTVFWEALLFVAAICVVLSLMLTALDRRPFASMGLAFFHGWQKELAQGVALGAAMILAVALAEWACGDVKFSVNPHSFALGGIFSFGLFVAAATKEEIIFRGYAFQRLVETITAAGAVALMSVLFGLIHFMNPHRTWISTLNTALVGVPLSLAYLKTRSLWMPIGMHFTWNFLQGFVLGLPVSGFAISSGLFSARVTGPERMTGGAYGPEGGVLASGVILVATAYLAFSKKIQPAAEMQRILSTPHTLPSRASRLTILEDQIEDKGRVGIP